MKPHLLFVCALAAFGAGCAIDRDSSVAAPKSSIPVAQERAAEADLSGRGLTEIPKDVFLRTDLVSLDLSNNKLTGAPPSQIGRLTRLVSLDLSDNALTGLPAELGQLSDLEVLDVSNNALTGLPLELGNLGRLRVLDLTGNPYSSQDIEAIAKKLPNTDIRR